MGEAPCVALIKNAILNGYLIEGLWGTRDVSREFRHLAEWDGVEIAKSPSKCHELLLVFTSCPFSWFLVVCV